MVDISPDRKHFPKRLGNAAIRLSLVLGAVVIALLIGEAAIRLLPPKGFVDLPSGLLIPHPTLGRVMPANYGPVEKVTSELSFQVQTNSYGLRDVEIGPKGPGVTRLLVLGAVRNSTAFRYEENERTDYYLAKAGGPTRAADIDQTYILKLDGSALTGYVKVRKLEAGDTIVVPISTEPRIRTIPPWKDLATIVSGFSIPLATIWAVTR